MKYLSPRLFSLIVLSAFASCTHNNIPYNQSGDWAAENQLNGPARSEAVSFVIGNFAYIGTGWDGLITRYADFWKYDPIANIWSQTAHMPGTGRSSAVAFAVDGKAYVGTGYDGQNFLADFYQFDTAGAVWTKKADFPGGGRYEAVAFGIDNFGYAGTGFDGSNALKDFYRYDPAGDSWTYIGFGGNKRYGAVVFTYGKAAYLTTGVNSGVLQNDFWKFDPTAGAENWTELRHISNYSTEGYDDGYSTIVRFNGAAFVIGPYAYISTGQNPGYDLDTWRYDFAADQWAPKTPFEGPPITGCVGFSFSSSPGGGYIATGRTGSTQAGASDYLWQFFPDQTQNPNNN